ncbi:unnamed protein product [Rotaria sordida]|uniref:Uncharacterized protein n=2 Tax=Rotaria sordida TaxID=392033 RepID=A0A814S6G9_9BILA|nr:unnamed protein product [Rotaria sordida]CAF4810566.1 unnamed protein product [Rotaria sp. Silwood1]CAF4933242.1 unnamed protein product [Rotaria sp. Silwood1]
MMMGDHIITVDHLLQLIKSSSSKLIHNLVKSDIRPKDRQNYPSCEKISSEAALNALSSVPYSKATQIYLQHHKHPESVQPGRNASLSSSVKPLTIEMIEESISKAYSNASRLMCEVNLYQHHEIPPLDEMSRLASLQLQKLEIVESSIPGESELDMESDSDDSNSEEEIVTTEDESSDEDSILNDEVLSDNLTAVSAVTYQGMRVFDSINPNLSKSYFVININGTKKYLHKQTAVWLLSNEKPTISSDRLRRFMTNRKT